jgi:hypothetical protein
MVSHPAAIDDLLTKNNIYPGDLRADGNPSELAQGKLDGQINT